MDVRVRWDVTPDGSVDGRLPSLQTVERTVLGARMIPGWVDDELQTEDDALKATGTLPRRTRARAWVALLEGTVHTALVRHTHFNNLQKLMNFSRRSRDLHLRT